MNTTTTTTTTKTLGKNDQRKSRFSFLLEEWVFQLALVVAVVSALVERGIAISGGTIV
jgi:hypothetical protein